MLLIEKLKKLKLKCKIKKNQYIGYNCGNARIKVAKDGLIFEARGISNIIWCNNPNGIDKEVIGWHVNKFAEVLKNRGNNPKNYDSFCKNVLPYYKGTWIPQKIRIDDSYIENSTPYLETQVIDADKLTSAIQRAVKNSAASDASNIPSAYVDDNGDLQHTDQPKQLVKKPKKDNKGNK